MAKDFYLVLQIAREATVEEIRAAYRRRAMELHPDKSGFSSEPFLELQEAYAVLSDPEQRAAYDREWESIPIRRSRDRGGGRGYAEPFSQVEPARGFRERSPGPSLEAFAASFDGLFERLWGQFDFSSWPGAARRESLTVEVLLSAAEARAGGSVRILVPARITCPTCGGRRGVGLYECWRCRGEGVGTIDYPLEVAYPCGLRRDYVVRVPLDALGMRHRHLTVRFRPGDRV